ncbi:MAG: hypothetical protein ACOX8Q_09495 [Christensenellales bacterium]|jgi:hypothetical protein
MRKTEILFGITAGTIGFVLAALSIFMLLPYSTETIKAQPADVLKTYAVICMAANAAGFIGALLVLKNNILGAVIMAAAMIAVLIFGFPWQSFSAVLFIISVVMATVPVKTTA